MQIPRLCLTLMPVSAWGKAYYRSRVHLRAQLGTGKDFARVAAERIAGAELIQADILSKITHEAKTSLEPGCQTDGDMMPIIRRGKTNKGCSDEMHKKYESGTPMVI